MPLEYAGCDRTFHLSCNRVFLTTLATSVHFQSIRVVTILAAIAGISHLFIIFICRIRRPKYMQPPNTSHAIQKKKSI